MSSDYLDIYLNDHLAGATGGVELARRVRKSNAGEREFATPLGRLCEEIEAIERPSKTSSTDSGSRATGSSRSAPGWGRRSRA
jgi:hypothetical protein